MPGHHGGAVPRAALPVFPKFRRDLPGRPAGGDPAETVRRASHSPRSAVCREQLAATRREGSLHGIRPAAEIDRGDPGVLLRGQGRQGGTLLQRPGRQSRTGPGVVGQSAAEQGVRRPGNRRWIQFLPAAADRRRHAPNGSHGENRRRLRRPLPAILQGQDQRHAGRCRRELCQGFALDAGHRPAYGDRHDQPQRGRRRDHRPRHRAAAAGGRRVRQARRRGRPDADAEHRPPRRDRPAFGRPGTNGPAASRGLREDQRHRRQPQQLVQRPGADGHATGGRGRGDDEPIGAGRGRRRADVQPTWAAWPHRPSRC